VWLLGPVFSLCIKFGANVRNNARVMAELWPKMWFSIWRPPPSWVYFRCLFLSFDRLWVVAVDVRVKFHNVNWVYRWLIGLCLKRQNGGCHYHELLFGNPGPPTKSTLWPEVCVKISCQSHYFFQRYGHLNILQIWLKMPIPAPKFMFFGGFWPQTLFFVIEASKGTSLGESASFKVYIVKIRPPVFTTRCYAERGYEIACRPSVCLSVRPSVCL